MSWPAIATFNTGSSSLKFSLHAVDGDGLGPRLLRGAVSDLHGTPSASLEADDAALASRFEAVVADVSREPAPLVAAIAGFLDTALGDVRLAACGHRIVHGGMVCDGPRLATADLIDTLQELSIFAPSHQPHNLAGVRAIAGLWPDRPQTLSFDTAFHRTAPDVAQRFALPRELTEAGLLRYGFHGLSFAHIADELPHLMAGRAHKRVIAAHLGSGASLCALEGGKSIATTMGLTALDGLMMATRCGDLDPGLVLHLIQDRGLSAGEVTEMLYKRSGLLGVSGISEDIRDLIASPATEAAEALELYVYRIVRESGALAAALSGLDALVFTGGVGENAADIRQRVCSGLDWLGVALDPEANAARAPIISAPDSAVTVAIVRADEERVIAEESLAVLLQANALRVPG